MACPYCGRESDGASADDDFAAFWADYPKHKAKADAEKAWRQTLRARPTLVVILDALEVQAKSRDWLKDGGAFVPLAATWLRGKRWLDEVTAEHLPTPARTVAAPMPSYDADWCEHEPRCISRDWHSVLVAKDSA